MNDYLLPTNNLRKASFIKMPKTIIFDTELLGGRFFFGGLVKENRNTIQIWGDKPNAQAELREVLNSGCLFVSFNGIGFDLPIIGGVLAGLEYSKLKRMANAIINENLKPWQAQRMYGLPDIKINHIDLMKVAPGMCGLKTYGARLHMPWLKDLPFPHDVETLADEEHEQVARYCLNDLYTTEALYDALHGPLELRAKMSDEYGIDLRSKSDTQMAEQSFVKRLNLSFGGIGKIPQTLRYIAPEFISFASPHLQELMKQIESHTFEVNQATGHIVLPDFLKDEIVRLNSGSYQLGIGGIHSTHDKKVCHIATDDYIIADIDAASYYPSIIINCNLAPRNTGQKFLDEYRQIYERRLLAKRTGDKATNEVLKISLNGTFGKTSERWSPLYSPDLTLAITITGQLTLLCLIERLEAIGATCLSANTDGIAIGCSKDVFEQVKSVVSKFENLTKFEFEYTLYKTLAMKDCNNYFAVKTDKKIKRKGIYAEQNLSKNPTASVCSQAVADWLAQGATFEETIKKSGIEGFLSSRKVEGGAVQGEEYLGRIVRWYQTTDKTLPPLTYKKNGNKVPKTDGARAAMWIDKCAPLPDDLDYGWYLKEAVKIATDVGASEFLTEEQRLLVAKPAKKRKGKGK